MKSQELFEKLRVGATPQAFDVAAPRKVAKKGSRKCARPCLAAQIVASGSNPQAMQRASYCLRRLMSHALHVCFAQTMGDVATSLYMDGGVHAPTFAPRSLQGNQTKDAFVAMTEAS